MKILCILYDDPKDGMPSSYPLKELPKLDKYPDGMTLPSPKGRDFTPGELLGCVSGELGLRKFFKMQDTHLWSHLTRIPKAAKQTKSWLMLIL